MKKLSVLISVLFLLLNSFSLQAQSKMLGDWEGILVDGQAKLKIIIHIRQDSTGGYKGTFDSPDQGAANLNAKTVDIKGDSLVLKAPQYGITIAGLYRAETDSLYTVLMQMGANIKIQFGRSSVSKIVYNRPQTPKPPFPYKIEEVTFVNKSANNIKLAGTLTIPDNVKNPPAVILITGSGGQDRDESLMEHKPFWVLADHLSRNGVAVLRYDDRGIAKSEGNFGTATSYDFSTDAEAALEYLRTRNDININKIGLLGHSEGGMIAPMVAVRNKNAAFIILLAGPGTTIDKLLLKQTEDFLRVDGKTPEEEVQKTLNLNKEVYAAALGISDDQVLDKKLREILTKYDFAKGNKEACDQFVKRLDGPWFRYFMNYKPETNLSKVKCPVLALNGTLDLQVNAEMNLETIRKALKKAHNKDFTLLYLQGMNHLFQEVKTGNITEYQQTEQTMSPKALETVSTWINKRF